MAEGTTHRLLDGLPQFLHVVRTLEEHCVKDFIEYNLFVNLLDFRGLVAAVVPHQEPWQALWQRPDLLWGGPDTLFESAPLFSALCKRLLSTESACSILAKAAQAHVAVLRGLLEHATPAQLPQLSADRSMRVLEAVAHATLDLLPVLFMVYCTQQATDDQGAALLKEVASEAKKMGKEAEQQELRAVQHIMLTTAADALWLTGAIMKIPSRLNVSGVVGGLSQWARVLKEAEACAWWEEGEDPASVALPVLLVELTLAYSARQKLCIRQQQVLLEDRGDVPAVVACGTLRFVHAELEKCLQRPPHKPCLLGRCHSMLKTALLLRWLLDGISKDEKLLELWLKVTSLADEAWEALAKLDMGGEGPVGMPHCDQITKLGHIRAGLLSLYEPLLKATPKLNARAAQLLEAAALNCAAADMRPLAVVCPLAFPGPGKQVAEHHMDLFVASHTMLAGYLKALADLEAPAIYSPAAHRPGLPRPLGSLAVAAALTAVRLGEAVVRWALGVGREALLMAESTEGFRGSSPAALCCDALSVASKWAGGKLPAASGTQSELYLLQLARGQSAMDALLSLLATQGKLAQEVARGLPLAAEEENHWEKLHVILWRSLKTVTLAALSLASRSGSSSSSSGGGSSDGGNNRGSTGGGEGRSTNGLQTFREKEAVVCLAIPAARHLASATCAQAAATDIFTTETTPMQTAFCNSIDILQSCHHHGMLPPALMLGAGTLLDNIFRAHLALHPSPREGAQVATCCVRLLARYPGLLPAGLHGGLVRHAVEVYLAWLRTDAFQVVQANTCILKSMQMRFMEICEAAAEHAGLPGVGPSTLQWAKNMLVHDSGFLLRFPRTKREQATAKEKLLHGWGLRAQQLCPFLERAARAAVSAELAPAPGAECAPEFFGRPLAGTHAPVNLGAALAAAAMEVGNALAERGDEHLLEAAGRTGAKGAADAEPAARLGLGQAAEQRDLELLVVSEALRGLRARKAASAEVAQPAAVGAAEGTPGSEGSTPAVASRTTRPTAHRMSSCPAMFAFLDVLVSRAGCANARCCNVSGASESELPRLLCRGCLSVRYCSEACGREDWPRHGCVCRLVCRMRLGLAHCRRAAGGSPSQPGTVDC